jgi:hypothetical protein
MEATIENLRKGLCAVQYDGSLDDLRRVLNAAFPKEYRRVMGTEKSYYKMGNTDWCGSSYGTELPAFSLQKFIDDLNNQPMTNKQKTLTSTDAQKIIDISCSSWKPKLANLWSYNIIMRELIVVEETFYTEMRKACTAEQHKLFDEIFGKDIKEPSYKIGDYVYVIKRCDNSAMCEKYADVGDVILIDDIVNNPYGEHKIVTSKEGHAIRVFEYPEMVRLATPEEIKASQWYPHQTLCLVCNNNYRLYKLRYSAKEVGQFYSDGLRGGPKTCEWTYHYKFDINNLPPLN